MCGGYTVLGCAGGALHCVGNVEVVMRLMVVRMGGMAAGCAAGALKEANGRCWMVRE